VVKKITRKQVEGRSALLDVQVASRKS